MIKKLIKNYYKNKGYDIVFKKFKIIKGDYEQALVFPNATYSPWYGDKEFDQLYKQINEHTMVDIYRCYELWQLCKELKDIPGDYIEVGTWRGGTGAIIAQQAQKYSPDAKVYICDTFEGVVKTSDKDSKYFGGEHSDTSMELVQSLYDKVGLKNTEILKGMFPDDTESQVTSDKFRLCHIDVDVYQGAKEITDWVWSRLSVGGMIVYDDYGFSTTQGVTEYVEEIRGKYNGHIIHNINGHAILIKLGE